MGLVTKKDNSFDESLNMFFSLPEEEKIDNYDSLKNKIYKLDIDNEEKANIINKINSINNNYLQKKDILDEIDRFKIKYNL